MNRKRSHEDLEDGDECLPISKRINSLHLEGKTHGHRHNQVKNPGEGGHLNGYHHADIHNLPLTAHTASLPPYHHALMQQPSSSHQVARYSVPDHHVASQACDRLPVPHGLPMASLLSPHAVGNLPCTTNGVYSNYEPFANNNNHLHINEAHHLHHPHNPGHHPSASLSPFDSSQPQAQHNVYPACENSHFGSNFLHPHQASVDGGSDANCLESLPSGPYEPELDVRDNPHYYGTNKMLYEAHQFRLQRNFPDYQLHS